MPVFLLVGTLAADVKRGPPPPLLRDRMLVLERCPEGIQEE